MRHVDTYTKPTSNKQTPEEVQIKWTTEQTTRANHRRRCPGDGDGLNGHSRHRVCREPPNDAERSLHGVWRGGPMLRSSVIRSIVIIVVISPSVWSWSLNPRAPAERLFMPSLLNAPLPFDVTSARFGGAGGRWTLETRTIKTSLSVSGQIHLSSGSIHTARSIRIAFDRMGMLIAAVLYRRYAWEAFGLAKLCRTMASLNLTLPLGTYCGEATWSYVGRMQTRIEVVSLIDFRWFRDKYGFDGGH